jgi:uncharacterized membrane protein YdfJ with MMPL/SSD domain
MLRSLADAIFRRRRLVLVATVVFVALAGAVGGPVAGLLDSSDDFDDPASEAVIAREAIVRATGASASPDAVALVRLRAPVESAEARAKLARVVAAMRDRDVAELQAYRPGGPSELVSADRRSTYVAASFAAGADDGDVVDRLQRRLEREPGVALGGAAVAQEQVRTQVSEDLRRAELLAFPILFLVSLVVFRGLVAALLPLAVGATTVLTTFALMRGANAIEPMSVFALNLVIGLGLGLSIDYSLFVISRFREELHARGETRAALAATLATAGRTVLFSAFTVAAALAALIVFPQRFLFSMGVGGVLVAVAAAAVSLTLLPALLAVLGPRVNALSLPRWRRAAERDAARTQAGFWYRLSQSVMRRPGTVAALTATLLIAIGLPFTGIRFTAVDASVLPRDHSARVVDDALRAEFPANRTSPLLVTVQSPARAGRDVRAYAQRLRAIDGVRAVGAPRRVGALWRIDVVAAGRAVGDRASDVLRAVRAEATPFPVRVGGATAEFQDRQASLADHLPIALAALALTTLAILFAMTGSVVLPVKALVMNALTVSAAFGLLVLIFQDGRLEGLLSYSSQGALDSSQPILLLATAFGLSTDYGVFLLARIKEARDAGASNDEAVAVGLQRTGRIVTAAAILFCIAIGAFATSEIVFIKELGVGTALAVLIDATIVRALLVPALMKLLGEWNWWAPRPLLRLHRVVRAS